MEVNDNDRKFLRFLWVDDINNINDNFDLVTYQFTRVLFDMRPSQFLLVAIIIKHLENYEADQEFIETFHRNLYADDSVRGAQSTAAAFELYLISKYWLLEAGLRLRKWQSNDMQLEQKFARYEKEEPAADIWKVLDVTWKNRTDTSEVKLDVLDDANENIITKRNVL